MSDGRRFSVADDGFKISERDRRVKRGGRRDKRSLLSPAGWPGLAWAGRSGSRAGTTLIVFNPI